MNAIPLSVLEMLVSEWMPTPETLDKAKVFLDDCKKTKNPFCLFIGSHDSHAPFTTGDPSVYDPKKIKVPSYWIDTPELRDDGSILC